MGSEIERQYLEKRSRYEEFGKHTKSLLEALLKNEKVHAIDQRVKDKESLLKKVERKENKYSSIDEITDIVGIRIICFYSDDVDKIARIISDEFIVDEDNSVDKREELEPEQFGYASLHYVVQYNDKRSGMPEYENFKGIRFEIQIRTILQHAWAEIQHGSGYKSEVEVPKKIRREFALLAGLLELADKEFSEIRENLEIYEEIVSGKLEKNEEDILIDKISLSNFISINKNLEKLNSAISEISGCRLVDGQPILHNKVEALNYLGFKYIHEIDKAITEEFDLCVEIAKQFLTAGRELEQSIGIFYLCFARLVQTGDIDKMDNYVTIIMNIGNPSYIRDKLLSVYSEFEKRNNL